MVVVALGNSVEPGFPKPYRTYENASEDEQISAYTQIAQIFEAQDKEDLARQALNSINDESQKFYALVAMSDAESKRDSKEKAFEFLTEAEHLADGIEQYALRSSAYNEIAARFQKLEKTEKARGILTTNLETIAVIRDRSSLVSSLAQLSDFFDENNIALNEREVEILKNLVRESMR